MTSTSTTRRLRDAESGDAGRGDGPGLEPDWMSWLAAAPTTPSAPVAPASAVGDPVVADLGEELGDDEESLGTTAQRIAAIERSVRKDSAARRRRRIRARVVVATTGVVVVLGAGTAVFAIGGEATSTKSPDSELLPSPATSASPAPTPAATQRPWCPDAATGVPISGSGPGDTTTGPGEIMHLNYQMYVRRDAVAARSVFAPGAMAAPLESTQAAVAAIPAGTQHCVYITPDGPDRYRVTVNEKRPDGSKPVWDSVATTATQADGRVMITAITAAG